MALSWLALSTTSTLPRHVPVLVLATALLGCDGPGVTRPEGAGTGSRPPIPVVVALGDSLTAGSGLPAAEAYPALLQARITAEGYRHLVVNAGLSGDTTAGGVNRVEAALVPDTRILIVALGANDGLRGVPVEAVRTNLERIIERARQRDIEVLLCGMETPPSRGWQYTLDFHQIFPELAARYRISLMPFLLAGVAGNPSYNLPDGIHPNREGARRIAENMWPYLVPLLIATGGA